MTNVLIVEDSRVSREAFERTLSADPEYSVVAAIENAANAEIACMTNQIDLILMDICTADDESGIRAAGKIKKNYPDTKIIMMTSMPEYSFMQKAKDSGSDSFWYKEYGETSLLEICKRTIHGEHVWPDTQPVVMIGLARSDEFTERELAVIRELAQGSRYEDITESLHISMNTVKYHVKNILLKTGFKTTLQLVAEVVEKRLILPKKVKHFCAVFYKEGEYEKQKETIAGTCTCSYSDDFHVCNSVCGCQDQQEKHYDRGQRAQMAACRRHQEEGNMEVDEY